MKNCNKKILVPSKYIKHLEITNIFNYGLTYQRNKIYTVFFSPNFDNEPNFQAMLQANFNEAIDACYAGSISRYFGKSVEKLVKINSFYITCLFLYIDTYEKGIIYMMWLRAKNTNNDAIENNIRELIDLTELSDADIDKVQEMVNYDDGNESFEPDNVNIVQENADESDAIHFFPPDAEAPIPFTSKIEAHLMDS